MDKFFYQKDGLTFLSKDYLKLLVDNNMVIDATSGGLLLGPFHKDGGIKVLYEVNDEYCIWAEFEGGEFLLNPHATSKNQDLLVELNSSTPAQPDNFELYSVDKNTKIIDARPKKIGVYDSPYFLLLTTGVNQMVINRIATRKHLVFLGIS